MATNPKEAVPTQHLVDIEGVKNGVLILKNGSLRQIILVSGLNFDLKSEEEQEQITFGYQAFLNSLSFTLQIFIHSRKINIDHYLENIKDIGAKEVNPLLKNQIAEYQEFIRSFVSENAIMDKSFFAIVPFDPIQVPSLNEGFIGKILGKKQQDTVVAEEKERQLAQRMSQLAQRTDQVISGLTQLGLRAVPLDDEETIELFYNLYNPETTEKKDLDLESTGLKS